MNNSFFEIVDLIAEMDSVTTFLAKEHNFAAYDYEKEGGKVSVSFYRLLDLEATLYATYPEFEFVVYHSNQYQKSFSEVEVYIKKEEKALLVTFHTDKIEKKKITYSLSHVSQDKRGFNVVTIEDIAFFPPIDEWKNQVFTYIQTLPAYRLHFATGTIELEEDLW